MCYRWKKPPCMDAQHIFSLYAQVFPHTSSISNLGMDWFVRIINLKVPMRPPIKTDHYSVVIY
jgi:hypothetical protein